MKPFEYVLIGYTPFANGRQPSTIKVLSRHYTYESLERSSKKNKSRFVLQCQAYRGEKLDTELYFDAEAEQFLEV